MHVARRDIRRARRAALILCLVPRHAHAGLLRPFALPFVVVVGIQHLCRLESQRLVRGCPIAVTARTTVFVHVVGIAHERHAGIVRVAQPEGTRQPPLVRTDGTFHIRDIPLGIFAFQAHVHHVVLPFGVVA